MSLNGLVHPKQEKCQSLNWSWVRAHQLAPQGLGPVMNQQMQCDYGAVAPYVDPREVAALERATPFRVWGYPAVTACSRLAPLLYAPRRDPNPAPPRTAQCQCGNCNRPQQQWPQGFFCGKSLPLEYVYKHPGY